MKHLLLAVFLFFFLLACKSSAPVEESAAETEPALDASLIEDILPVEEEGPPEPAEDIPEISDGIPFGETLPAELPVPEAPAPEDFPEPESEKPDTVSPPEMPADENRELPEPRLLLTLSPALPVLPVEPSPELSAVPEVPPVAPPPTSPAAPDTVPPGESDSPRTIPAPSPVEPPENPVLPDEAPRQDPPSPAPELNPPAPPSFLRPAEPELPPPVRQPVPMPADPLPDLPARTPPAAAGDEIVFSRVVRATVGQIIEIPFRGTGWVYLGELGNRRGMVYDSRRLDIEPGDESAEGQTFVFRAEAPGTYVLKFYKQDFIQDFIINDYVQVIVGEDSLNSGAGYYSADRGRVIAEPRWPPSSESAGAGQGIPSEAGVQVPPVTGVAQEPPLQSAPPEPSVPATVPPEEISSPENLPPAEVTVPRPRQGVPDEGIVAIAPPLAVSPAFPADTAPEEFVRRAKEEFDAGRVEQALVILDTMKQRYPSGTDEAWWLYGQLLEANSPSRDIRLALEYYRRLIRQYPQSPRAGDAQRRIAYLERYYFNIR